MIYDFPGEDTPIRQGDIFISLPRIDLNLDKVPVLEEGRPEQPTERTWDDIAREGREIAAIVGVRPVAAIVATQDCDTLHERDITLCEIRPFLDVDRVTPPATLKAWASRLTQHARINLKWFYLPPDERLGFSEKMAVDFRVTIRVPRINLEQLRGLRRGRLNPLADEHFRERISEFFRRYPYDEWYCLNSGELAAYQRNNPGVKPFPWQEEAPPKAG